MFVLGPIILASSSSLPRTMAHYLHVRAYFTVHVFSLLIDHPSSSVYNLT